MARNTINIKALWEEVKPKEIDIKKSKEAVGLLIEAVEILIKEVISQAIKNAYKSGRRIVTKEDMKYALKDVLGFYKR